MDPLHIAEHRLGSVIAGKYKLGKVLGLGGMGVVYEARHTFTDRKVALKLLHEAVARVPNAAERFLAEAKVVAPIRHPSIVEVLDAGEEPDGTLYLVFEMLVGRDLGSMIKDSQVTHDSLLPLVLQVLDVLALTHKHGMVHRDIKPENIFLTVDEKKEFRVKLLDFGIARRITGKTGDGLTAAGAIVGTPSYMSPEQFMGDAIDGRTDLWALGVVLYRALAGVLPFKAERYETLVRAVLIDGPPSIAGPRADLPPEVIRIVDRAMTVDRDKRWQSAEEMAKAIRDYLANEAAGVAAPIPARPTQASSSHPALTPPTMPPGTMSISPEEAARGARVLGATPSRGPSATQVPTPAPPVPLAARTPPPPAASSSAIRTTAPPPAAPPAVPAWEAALKDIQSETDRLKNSAPPGKAKKKPEAPATPSLFGKLFGKKP